LAFSVLQSPLINSNRKEKQEKAVDAAELGGLPSFLSRSFIYFMCGKISPWIFSFLFFFYLIPFESISRGD